ncbi:MAG: hypothetical protein AAF724_12495 [Pseudomonadota bacterium]
MRAFRIVILFQFAVLTAYTIAVIDRHGTDFWPVFFGDLFAVNWSGQFNLDFFCYLVLSALWVAWRHRFSALGLVLALFALIGGLLYFAIYLSIVAARAKGDVSTLLLGEQKGRA